MDNYIELECAVFPGMFSDERVVQLCGHDDAFFVSEAAVHKRGQKHFLKAFVFECHGTKWARLPTDYGRCIPVDDNLLCKP